MSTSAALNSLLERIMDAPAPERSLFVEAWLACAGNQSPDLKAHFAMLLETKAWTDAALVTVACALPRWHVVTSGRPMKAGKARLLQPKDEEGIALRPYGEEISHPGGVSLAILGALVAAAAGIGER